MNSLLSDRSRVVTPPDGLEKLFTHAMASLYARSSLSAAAAMLLRSIIASVYFGWVARFAEELSQGTKGHVGGDTRVPSGSRFWALLLLPSTPSQAALTSPRL